MTTKKHTKLKLNRETLRQLSDDELQAAQGGSALTQGGNGGVYNPVKSRAGGICIGQQASVTACTVIHVTNPV